MKSPIQVLHLLGPNEEQPPDNLQIAAAVRALRVGPALDASVFSDKPQVISLRTPVDREVTETLSQLAGLDLPILGVGEDAVKWLDAQVSEHISPEDLRSLLDLLSRISTSERYEKRQDDATSESNRVYRFTEDVIALIEHLMCLRFPSYAERTKRVLQSCMWIGTHLALASHALRELSYAARLREVGKLGLPDHILLKPREHRTPEEQAIYDRYPALGAMAVSEFSALRDAARIVGHQLENFDGSGPSGLMAHQIPLAARVLRVAGAYEMIMEETRIPRTESQALELLERGRGSLFDPLLVKLYFNYRSLNGQPERKTDTVRVTYSDLTEGMILAEDVWSRTGMKIAARGTRLTPHTLRILYSLPSDPTIETVEVYRH